MSLGNNDTFISGPAALLVLGLRAGDLEACNRHIDKTLPAIRRAAQEEDQGSEAFGLCVAVCGDNLLFCWLLGRSAEVASCMEACGFTWDRARATVVRLNGAAGGQIRDFGKFEEFGAIFSAETVWWNARMLWLLNSATPGVSAAEVLRALPSPAQLAEWQCTIPGSAPAQQISSPHLLAALVCEKYGQGDRALGFLDVVFKLDPKTGGDFKTSSHIMAHAIHARLLAAKGEMIEAEATLEAAIERATSAGYWLLVAMALRDLHRLVLSTGSRGAEAKRRLRVAISKLKGPPDLIEKLLAA